MLYDLVEKLLTGHRACVLSALRIVFGQKLVDSPDSTFSALPALCVSAGEMAAIMLVVCFPTMRRLFLHIQGNSMWRFDRCSTTITPSEHRLTRRPVVWLLKPSENGINEQIVSPLSSGNRVLSIPSRDSVSALSSKNSG